MAPLHTILGQLELVDLGILVCKGANNYVRGERVKKSLFFDLYALCTY